MKTIPNTPCKTAPAATALVLLLAIPVHAATFALNPSTDAFVTTGPTGNLSGNNYGSAGALSVAASGLANGEFQSVLRFDLSAAHASFDTQFGASQWNIQSITLSLTAMSPNNAIFNSSAAGQFGISWTQNDSWTEGTGNPNTPATSGITYTSLTGTFIDGADENLGTFSFSGGTSTSRRKFMNIQRFTSSLFTTYSRYSDVHELTPRCTSGTANYTLSLTPTFSADASAGNLVSFRLFAADTTVSYLFDSRSFGTTSFRPLLSIVAVPEPGALSLLPAAAVLLLGARCRRKHQE